MAQSPAFRFYIPAQAFEKAKPGGGTSLRIGGIVSTEHRDQQGEVLLREALDFGPFERRGYFNDNHGKSTADVVGYPTASVKWYNAGAQLPNGTRAAKGGFWAEGVLVGERGRQIWQIAKDLEGTGRSLGFSVQGRVKERDLANPNVVAKAVVDQVAVTHCPVNADTYLTTLAKAMYAGSAVANPGAAAGSGFALRSESLEPEVRLLNFSGPSWPPVKRRRPLSKAAGIAYIKAIYPAMDDKRAGALYRLARQMKALGAV